MIDTRRNTFNILLSTFGILIILYQCHGFIAFNNDTIETIPYAQWLHDSTIFSKDFHIQYISNQFPNERYWISWTLHFFPNAMLIASMLFHFLFSVMLISGMLRLAEFILDDLNLSALSVILTLGLLYNFNIGGNELYYNMYVSSLAGKALGVWSIYFFITKKIFISALMLGIATLCQPLVGIQLFIILSGVHLLEKKSFIVWAQWILVYGIIGGIWFVLLLLHQKTDSSSLYQFSDIIYSRIGHHFYPSLFSWKKSIPIVLIIVYGMYQFYSLSKSIFYFFLMSIIGIFVYLIGIYLDKDIVLSTQWMKTTIWLKFFGCIALVYPFSTAMFIEQKRWKIFLLTLALVGSLILNRPTYDYEYDKGLIKYVKENTEVDALFIVPLEMTDFRARTKRSTYFDYKAMIHHRPHIYEWAERLKKVYNIDIKKKEYIGFNGVKNKYLSSPESLPLSDIDYVIAPKNFAVPSDWKEAFSTDQYRLYKIKK